jgi:amino acid transporter
MSILSPIFPDRMSSPPPGAAGLRRVLTLRDLILYGIVVIQPVAPMSAFGVVSTAAHGHAVTAILVAMVGMLLTAISYGRMARAYPAAGSAFTYVGQEVNPALGFATGWAMVMDYMINPLICIILCSKMAMSFMEMNFAVRLPYWPLTLFFFLLFTGLNLRGIKASARTNTLLAAGMGVVIAVFFVAAARYVSAQPHHDLGFYTRPFYDPQTFQLGALLSGTSLAVLTYIGFDGISTLSEEAENPRRNILLATVFTCLAIGILSAFQVYAAQLIWPSSERFPDVDTAFIHVAGRAAGPWMFNLINLTLLVATIGSGMGAQIGAARLLYGMGRSSALPRSFFGAIEPRRGIPRNNVILVGVVALVGALVLDWAARLGATTAFGMGVALLNFGALIAFMGVNLAAFVRYFVREPQKKLTNLLPPVFGFLICLLLWLNLSATAKIIGVIWLGVGIGFGAWKTSGFKSALVSFDLPPEERER